MKNVIAFCLLLLIGSFVHGGSSPPQSILPEISPGFNPYQVADCFAQALPVVTTYEIGLVKIHSEAFPYLDRIENYTLSPTAQVKNGFSTISNADIQAAFVRNPLKSNIGTNKLNPSNGGNLTYSIPPDLYNCHLPAS